MRVKNIAANIMTKLWLLAMILVILIPVVWMITGAFTAGDSLTDVPFLLPYRHYETGQWVWDYTSWEFSMEHFNYIFTFKSTSSQILSDYMQAFLITLQIALVTTILTVILAVLTGFAISRYRFKGKKPLMLVMVSLQMLPSFSGMIALLLMFKTFGLLNNHYALALIYAAGSIPVNAYIVRGFMQSIPKSLDEAAAIDGASNGQIFRKILLPLAMPIVGFIAIGAFMAPWLDYILQSILLPTANQTVSVYLMPMSNPMNAKYDPLNFFAGALLLAIPIMIVQIYMQRFITGGLTAGADKG